MQRKGARVAVASMLAVAFLSMTATSDAVMVLAKGTTIIGNIIILNAESADATANGTALLNALGSLIGSPGRCKG